MLSSVLISCAYIIICGLLGLLVIPVVAAGSRRIGSGCGSGPRAQLHTPKAQPDDLVEHFIKALEYRSDYRLQTDEQGRTVLQFGGEGGPAIRLAWQHRYETSAVPRHTYGIGGIWLDPSSVTLLQAGVLERFVKRKIAEQAESDEVQRLLSS